MDNFHARWFGRTQPPPPAPEQLWQQNTEFLRNMATSEWGEALADRFKNIPEVEEAEKQFAGVLQSITDPEIRFAVDAAAGRISSAYQVLGFCAGRFSQDSRAQMV
mgnify:CR=1 FL=1